MSKIRSDLRVRTRGCTNVTSDSSYASDSYFTNKPSGSDSKFRSDFRHWTRAHVKDLKEIDDRGYEWMFFDACKNKWINTKGKGIRSSAYHQTCRYLHHDNPFLKIGPFIEEQLSKSPYMVIYHDILTDKEIEYLIKESQSHLSTIRKEVNEPNIHDYKSGKARKIIRKAD